MARGPADHLHATAAARSGVQLQVDLTVLQKFARPQCVRHDWAQTAPRCFLVAQLLWVSVVV